MGKDKTSNDFSSIMRRIDIELSKMLGEDLESDIVINHLRKAIGNILEDKDIMECLEKDITQGMDEWFAFFFVALSAGPLSEDVDVEKVLQGLKLKLGNNNQ